MWARPDTGSAPSSYPMPTWSAARGILQSIAFLSDGRAWINPEKVEICRRKGSHGGLVNYQRYTNNYRGPLYKRSSGAYQFSSIIVTDVCYRLYATIENGSGGPLAYGKNPCHHLQAMFNRRLQKGQCHKTPCLGWNEFVASYWGEFREDKFEKDNQLTVNLVSVLRQVFDSPISGRYAPTFQRGNYAWIRQGELIYAQ